MKYMGSKNRIAKYILPIILKDRKEDQWYVEPFCGGCNLIDKVTGNRNANDNHFELIEMFKALQKGWIPPNSISEQEYYSIKDSTNAVLRGYVGFNLSFAGKYWGGYARGVSRGVSRNYGAESYRNILKQVPNLKDVLFTYGNYNDLYIRDNSIIYCDPPYKGTTKYNSTINYEEFYSWCRLMRSIGHTIFISEYNMPDDFICVWQKEVTVNLTNQTKALKAVEKLFTLP